MSGLKSAFDLAMDRMTQRGEGLSSLTGEQKEAMAEIASQRVCGRLEKTANAYSASNVNKSAPMSPVAKCDVVMERGAMANRATVSSSAPRCGWIRWHKRHASSRINMP